MLGFGKKNKITVDQKDVHRLLTELKHVPLPEARQKINAIRKSATRDSKSFLDILEAANGLLYYARRREQYILLDIFQKGKGKIPVNVMDTVLGDLAKENPNLCRWLALDVLYADKTPEEKVMAKKEVERVIKNVSHKT